MWKDGTGIFKVCPECGESFELVKGMKGQIYCSKKCARTGKPGNRKGKLKQRVIIVCAYCKKEFIALPSSRRIYCCRGCKDSAMVGVPQPYNKKEYPARECPQCHSVFQITRLTIKKKFCSDECYIASITGKIKTLPEIKRELRVRRDARQNHARRVRKRGSGYERFDAIEIYERDNWKCHLCGKKIDRKHKWPHSLSPSLDHIVPISLGGGHLRTNVKAAHLGCNSSKGKRSRQEQLSLL